MTKREMKARAQEMIMEQIACVGYGNRYEEYIAECGDEAAAWEVLKEQCDRVARLFGEKEAWFY